MELLLNQLINGLTAGSEYALIAAGLALIFGVLEVVNFAHGEFYMLSSYYLYLLMTRYNLPYVVAVPLVIVAMILSGVIFYYLVIRRVLSRSWQLQLIATLALSIVMVNTAIVLSGPVPKYLESPLNSQIVQIGMASISVQRLVVLAATAISFATLYAVLKYTRIGKAMRAVAQNREAAAAVGISVEKVGLATVVAGCALAGVAGALISPLYTIHPGMAALVIIKAFAAVIVGGFGNVTGAVLAAFLIGLLEALVTTVLPSEYADAFVFGGMILVLLVRPHGLFGRVARS